MNADDLRHLDAEGRSRYFATLKASMDDARIYGTGYDQGHADNSLVHTLGAVAEWLADLEARLADMDADLWEINPGLSVRRALLARLPVRTLNAGD